MEAVAGGDVAAEAAKGVMGLRVGASSGKGRQGWRGSWGSGVGAESEWGVDGNEVAAVVWHGGEVERVGVWLLVKLLCWFGGRWGCLMVGVVFVEIVVPWKFQDCGSIRA